MQLRILQASTFALDNLKKASVPTVHSVYHKAVNLRIGDQMLTLQPRASVLSPVSLITDYTEEMLADLTFMVGQQLTFHLNTSHTCCQDLFFQLRCQFALLFYHRKNLLLFLFQISKIGQPFKKFS